MAGGTLASLLIKLGLDASGVETGAAKAKGAMGGIGISGRTLAAGGLAAAAAGFAVLSRGAQDLEGIQAKFQASTGASAQEAHDFATSVNAMSGEAVGLGQSLDSIAAAGTAVRTELGLSGDAADTATRQILSFSRATGQDAAEAVRGVDDILDSFNLTADATPGILDKITYASQHGAGSVGEIEANLASLAPALNAANLTFDDGAALLLQFGQAGVDGADASKALTKALGKVKSPQELQRLMDDISNTIDPFERSRKAAELFGAKAGTKMAQVLKPGMSSLKDMVKELDKTDGAAQDAADAMNSTFGAKFQGLMNGAKSALRGFGQDFGPVLSGLGSLASVGGSLATTLHLDKAIGGAFDALKNSTVVKTAAGAAGSAAGAVYSAALKVAEGIGSALSSAWETIKSTAAKLYGAAVSAAGAIAGGIYSAAVAVAQALGDALSGAWTAVKNSGVVKAAAAAAGAVVGAIYGAASAVVSEIVEHLSDLWAKVSGHLGVRAAAAGAGAVAGSFYATGMKIAEALTGAIKTAWGVVNGSVEIATAASAAGTAAGTAFITGALLALPALAVGILRWIQDNLGLNSGVPQAWGGTLKQTGQGSGQSFVDGVISGLVGLRDRIAAAIRSAFAAVFPINIGPIHISASGVTIDLPHISLPSFAVGSPFIPADMVAQIHKGEMIVPAGPAAAFRDMLDALGRVSSFSGFGALGLAVAGGSPAGTHAAEPSRVADFVNSGDTIVLNIGTLYGGKQGLDELMRAIDDRRRQTNR